MNAKTIRLIKRASAITHRSPRSMRRQWLAMPWPRRQHIRRELLDIVRNAE